MTDLIKRSDALEVVYRYCPDDDGSCSCADRDLREMLDDIEDIPSADRPQGECLKEAEILLKATRNLLNKQNGSIYVLNMLEETVAYYGVECDGSCLIEDIDAWLELYGSEEGADDE